jgi:hypothetical protein
MLVYRRVHTSYRKRFYWGLCVRRLVYTGIRYIYIYMYMYITNYRHFCCPIYVLHFSCTYGGVYIPFIGNAFIQPSIYFSAVHTYEDIYITLYRHFFWPIYTILLSCKYGRVYITLLGNAFIEALYTASDIHTYDGIYIATYCRKAGI